MSKKYDLVYNNILLVVFSICLLFLPSNAAANNIPVNIAIVLSDSSPTTSLFTPTGQFIDTNTSNPQPLYKGPRNVFGIVTMGQQLWMHQLLKYNNNNTVTYANQQMSVSVNVTFVNQAHASVGPSQNMSNILRLATTLSTQFQIIITSFLSDEQSIQYSNVCEDLTTCIVISAQSTTSVYQCTDPLPPDCIKRNRGVGFRRFYYTFSNMLPPDNVFANYIGYIKNMQLTNVSIVTTGSTWSPDAYTASIQLAKRTGLNVIHQFNLADTNTPCTKEHALTMVTDWKYTIRPQAIVMIHPTADSACSAFYLEAMKALDYTPLSFGNAGGAISGLVDKLDVRWIFSATPWDYRITGEDYHSHRNLNYWSAFPGTVDADSPQVFANLFDNMFGTTTRISGFLVYAAIGATQMEMALNCIQAIVKPGATSIDATILRDACASVQKPSLFGMMRLDSNGRMLSVSQLLCQFDDKKVSQLVTIGSGYQATFPYPSWNARDKPSPRTISKDDQLSWNTDLQWLVMGIITCFVGTWVVSMLLRESISERIKNKQIWHWCTMISISMSVAVTWSFYLMVMSGLKFTNSDIVDRQTGAAIISIILDVRFSLDFILPSLFVLIISNTIAAKMITEGAFRVYTCNKSLYVEMNRRGANSKTTDNHDNTTKNSVNNINETAYEDIENQTHVEEYTSQNNNNNNDNDRNNIFHFLKTHFLVQCIISLWKNKHPLILLGCSIWCCSHFCFWIWLTNTLSIASNIQITSNWLILILWFLLMELTCIYITVSFSMLTAFNTFVVSFPSMFSFITGMAINLLTSNYQYSNSSNDTSTIEPIIIQWISATVSACTCIVFIVVSYLFLSQTRDHLNSKIRSLNKQLKQCEKMSQELSSTNEIYRNLASILQKYLLFNKRMRPMVLENESENANHFLDQIDELLCEIKSEEKSLLNKLNTCKNSLPSAHQLILSEFDSIIENIVFFDNYKMKKSQNIPNIITQKQTIDFCTTADMLQHPIFFEMIKDCLHSIKCVENTLFIEAINYLKSCKDIKKRRKMSIWIQSTFLEEGSIHEINIVGTLRKQIISQLLIDADNMQIWNPIVQEIVKLIDQNLVMHKNFKHIISFVSKYAV